MAAVATLSPPIAITSVSGVWFLASRTSDVSGNLLHLSVSVGVCSQILHAADLKHTLPAEQISTTEQPSCHIFPYTFMVVESLKYNTVQFSAWNHLKFESTDFRFSWTLSRGLYSLPQMDGSVPPLDAVELRAISETLTVKEVKKLLKDLQVDVTGCLEKLELVTALVDRLKDNEKLKASLFSYCRICCNWRLDDDVWPLTCGHLVCFPCLGKHLESQVHLMKSSLKYKLPCIYAPACDYEIRFQDAASMSDAFRRIWKDLQHRERLIRDAKFEVLECPKADCVGVAYSERGRRMAMCFLCEHTWETNQSAHEKEWEKPGFDGERVRRCPKCQAPIEKNGGCNHMQCTRCGRDFDWASSQPAGERKNGSGPSDQGNGSDSFDFGSFADFFGNQHAGAGGPFQGWQAHVGNAANQAGSEPMKLRSACTLHIFAHLCTSLHCVPWQVFNAANVAAHHAQHIAAHAAHAAQAAQAARAAHAGAHAGAHATGHAPFTAGASRETRDGQGPTGATGATEECVVMWAKDKTRRNFGVSLSLGSNLRTWGLNKVLQFKTWLKVLFL